MTNFIQLVYGVSLDSFTASINVEKTMLVGSENWASLDVSQRRNLAQSSNSQVKIFFSRNSCKIPNHSIAFDSLSECDEYLEKLKNICGDKYIALGVLLSRANVISDRWKTYIQPKKGKKIINLSLSLA